MRESHVQSEAKLQVRCRDQSQLPNDPGRGEVWRKHNAEVPGHAGVQGKLVTVQHFESVTLAIIPINFQRRHGYRKRSDILDLKVLCN